MSISGQGHSLTLVKGHSDFKVKCLNFGLYTQVSNSGPLGPLVNIVLKFSLALIDQRQCAGSEPAVQARLESLASQWETLVAKSAEKSEKLKEASRQQTYNAGVKDVEFWLGEVNTVRFTYKENMSFLKYCSLKGNRYIPFFSAKGNNFCDICFLGPHIPSKKGYTLS